MDLLENLVHRLTARIDALENAAAADDGPPISLEGTQIKNMTQLKAWLVAHTSPTLVDLVPCFPDVLALLGMVSRSTKDDVNSLDLESKAVKAGYGSVNHFLISKSFTLSLPAIFGVEKEGGTGDVRTLSKFKTFESFDTQVTFTGGLNDIKQEIEFLLRLRNQRHFGQAETDGTPFTVESIKHKFNWSASTNEAELVLKGE
jgi:hypothetical protein